MSPYTAARRFIGARQNAQQRRLACAVAANEPDALAVLELKAHVLQRAYTQAVTSIAPDAPACAMMQQAFLQRTRTGVVDRENDRDRFELKVNQDVHTQ